jgi:predicted Zn-dependent protease
MATRRALLILGALALGGCLQDDGGRFNPLRDATTVSEDEERELGLRFDEELRKHARVIEDPVVAGFIQDLGQEVVRTLEPQPFVYRFRVVRDPSLNAFAVPGGYVYFHSGTLLAAGSLDELAGVMGHEIAHVKGHHYARMRKKSQIPDLLAGLAGMGAAVATGRPELLAAAQAVNVAVQLKWSREFEDEADRLGAVFVSRSGWNPAAITRFFERILALQELHPHDLPPYLFSHPDVEDRIESVRQQAEELRPLAVPDPSLAEAFPDVQARLAWMVDRNRESVPPESPPEHPERVDPLLQRADDLAQERRFDEALLVLASAESLEPRDPRVPFRVAELLAAQGRHREAVLAFQRTIRLDPTRALVFYQLGLSHQALGERHNAVYAFEQASRRAGAQSALRQRADWQVETLIFPPLVEVGFADGEGGGGETPLGHPRTSFPFGARRIAWWARLHSRYNSYADAFTLRWSDPRGQLVAETPVTDRGRPWLGALLELEPPGAATPGEWSAEVRFQQDLVDRRTFLVQPER